MKSILYAGAALMLAAGIYGFVDYKKTNDNKEFKTMYREEGATVPNQEEITEAPWVKEELSQPANNAKNGVKANEKGSGQNDEKVRQKKNREVNSKLFSRAPLKEMPIEKEVEN